MRGDYLDILHRPCLQLLQHAALVMQSNVKPTRLQGQLVVVLTCFANSWLR
jgi:hypothetical protein